jgi:hypothetical protein
MLGRLSERCFGKLLLTQACIEIFSGKLLIEKPAILPWVIAIHCKLDFLL